MQASSKDNRKRLTLNHFSSNLVLGADSENGNLTLGFSKTIKEFET
jgi:hypothetical protein